MKNLDSVSNSRDDTLPTKVHSNSFDFPHSHGQNESWTINKAECQRIDAFKMWCWRRLLKVTWTARSNLSILRENNPEYSLKGLMLKLKLQYFGHLMQINNSLKKSLILGKIEEKRVSVAEMAGQHH